MPDSRRRSSSIVDCLFDVSLLSCSEDDPMEELYNKIKNDAEYKTRESEENNE